MNRNIPGLLLIACVLCGCKTQTAMTASATGCRTISVDIIDSRYSREGSTTAWCAKCNNKLYQCVSNPDHSRTQCKETVPGACE